MKAMKIYLLSTGIGGMVFVFFGAFLQSYGCFKIGGIAIAIAVILWIALGYAKRPIKTNNVAHLLLVIGLSMFLLSCTKDNKNSSASVRPTRMLDGNLTAQADVSINNLPFAQTEVFATPADRGQWNLNTIRVNHYAYNATLETYVIASSKNKNLLFITYNPQNKKFIKMVTVITPVSANAERYEYFSTSGVFYVGVTATNENGYKYASDIKLGTQGPDVSSLFSHQAIQVATTPWGDCMKAQVVACSEKWYCAFSCGAAAAACFTGMALACMAS